MTMMVNTITASMKTRKVFGIDVFMFDVRCIDHRFYAPSVMFLDVCSNPLMVVVLAGCCSVVYPGMFGIIKHADRKSVV